MSQWTLVSCYARTCNILTELAGNQDKESSEDGEEGEKEKEATESGGENGERTESGEEKERAEGVIEETLQETTPE